MSERHPLFLASGPAIPSARLFILLAVVLSLMAGQFVDWAYGRFQDSADEARVFLTWAGLTLAANLTGFAFVPVSRWLQERFPACRSGPTSWIAFYGLFGLVQAALMAGRSWAGTLWLPEIFTARSATVAALNGFQVNMILFAVAERAAAADRDSRAHQARLARLSDELQHSKAQMVVEDDRMRSEVARVLHGELQTLLLLSWAELGEALALREKDRPAYELKRRNAEQRLDRAIEALESGLAGWLSAGDGVDLYAALEKLVESFAPVLRVRLELDPRMERTALPPAATRAAYRLVQEALLNALKHARAREVCVVVREGPGGGLALSVMDDGRGFGAGLTRGGLGFSVLGKELEAHGGTWTVNSAPGKGTRLLVGLPAERTSA